ncbi:NF-X1-type zinc finger protein nfxl1 [Halocaridina rubra]|uniref:NF-X1-type zinc finger protein nfxl1 n=1 Tax=Halocaridina rubra TaxID=373956 RepID=A0AAN8WQW6_HALRR
MSGHGQRGRGQRGRGRGGRSWGGTEGFWDIPKSRGTASRGRGRAQSTDNNASLEEETRAGERKFADACREIQENVEKYIAKHQFVDEESEEEEEDDLEEDGILDKWYKGYEREGESCRTDQFLRDACKTGAHVCLICINNIKRTDAIWSCVECFCSFHMSCVQKWAKDSIFQLAEAHLETNPHFDKSTLKWCCPKCRSEYGQSLIPRRYVCFCGKQEDPKYDPWIVPHSCGETCRKKLKPECGHSCLLLCHPGPCPPCPITVNIKCHCNRQPAQTRRCSSKYWSCCQPCGKKLSCGQHTCEDPCHAGDCNPCPRKSLQPCSCGNEKQMRLCADPAWQCDKVCGKRHSCGHHVCQAVCHKGACGECPSSGERTCPCGKTSHILPCTEKIPTCGDTCGKELSCGSHFCADRCHKGACSSCLQFRLKKCRCGAREKEMVCSKEFTCEIKCKTLKDCRRHNCSRKCCDGKCAPCENVCGRTLSCRNHKCKSRCHPGPCYPCNLTHQVKCYCKTTFITVPCGREKTVSPPKCSLLCRIPPSCHHPTREKHKCHFGNCPQCKMTCGRHLNCGHACPSSCHDAVPVKIVSNKKREAWEPIIPPRIEIKKKPCPPCTIPVPTTCFGNHETVNWPCHDVRPHSCGRKCGRRLACSNHTCNLECHAVNEARNEIDAGKNCPPCEVGCSKPRPDGCNHKCNRPCHRGECAKCAQLVKFKCHCGLNNLYQECHILTAATTDKDALNSCKNQCNKTISCGHRCTKDCHSGSCSEPEKCRKRVPLRCACKRIKKDFLCTLVVAGEAKLECDSVCLEKKKATEEEERRKKEGEEEKKRLEYENFEKLAENRKNKRRNRRRVDSEAEKSSWKDYWFIFLAVFVIFCGCIIYSLSLQ